MDEGFTLWDADLNLVAWNKAVVKLLEWPAALAQKGIHISKLLAHNAAQGDYGEGDSQTLVNERLVVLSSPQRKTYCKHRRNGECIELNVFPLDTGSVVITYRDVTQRNRSKASETRLGRIVERSLNEIYVFNAETMHFVQVNHGARTNLGYDMEELRALTPLYIKPEHTQSSFDDLIKPLVDKTMDKIVFETVHERKDKSTYDVEVHLQLIAEEDPPVFVAITQDITRRKKAENELRLALINSDQASRAKSEFLANMSHELRTPLNAIIGFSEIVKDEIFGSLSNDKYREYATDIHDSGQHLLDLINDILDLSKVESGADDLLEESVDIQELMGSVLSLVKGRAKKNGIQLDVEIEEPLPLLFTDNRKLKQILINLLTNAIKFTLPGGKVTLRAWCGKETGHVFQVIDTGIGISREDVPRALAPFQQIDRSLNRRYEGTGLGLSLSKRLVEQHGGFLDLQSQPGVGTTVTVYFPAQRISQTI